MPSTASQLCGERCERPVGLPLSPSRSMSIVVRFGTCRAFDVFVVNQNIEFPVDRRKVEPRLVERR